ncbi:CFA/I fimbrial subunit D domain protein [Escherichia coli P0298942.6]|nr:CFA/I fimbrial subunit D domain protein [Escherichia coli P0298942.1]ENA88961.1 CFA/I fimbrial subunit D domain protein [Escherichia coli 2862600]ENB47161.1 CFA/I fimbrial subunit D domain protein [Escherichia coli P0298942.10]ENB50238.1 CFA/I fimbrial subunit D domain protein [Escherichia coli P0298942.12]ENB53414.1 CFA/I fimbrial subunit D domain protein [Escherichia coli P0298942.14]ENB54565.1 CFA/I fimbrial subunit D domain protein [Escherichia coli P0298942.11]ENB69210.1 CFA/I fimbria
MKTEVDKTLLDVLKNINSYDDSAFISNLIYLISKIENNKK